MEYELYHYGVKGMKWGIRRYRNADGTLTPEGKRKARQEYDTDNRRAFELGKNATVYGHAAARSMRRTINIENKLDKKYSKDPDGIKRGTQTLGKKWYASAMTTAQLVESYTKHKSEAEKHCQSLINKYGKEAVSSISYKNIKLPKGKYSPSSFTTINEKTNTASDYARAAGKSLLTTGVMQMFGIPFAALYTPGSSSQKGQQIERTLYKTKLEYRK